MPKPAKPTKKRIGRPTKPPAPGERVPLGLRVTPEMKRRLEAAATKKGRSLSQEVELRLERSLDFARHLIIAQGDLWSPVLIHNGELLIGIGDDPRDYPVPLGAPPHQEDVVALKISEDDLARLMRYFAGAFLSPPSKEEIDAFMQEEEEIKRGK